MAESEFKWTGYPVSVKYNYYAIYNMTTMTLPKLLFATMPRRMYPAAYPNYRSKRDRHSNRGFTLVELLVVLAIVIILTVIAVPAMQGLGGASKFNGNITQVAGILEQARAYANGQNTYVWVAFYPLDPTTVAQDSSGDQLYVAVYASSDGTDPFSATWSGTYAIPYTVSGTTISQIFKLASFKQLHINTTGYFTPTQIPSLPASLASPTPPASSLKLSLKLNNMPVTLSAQPVPSGVQAPATSVIEFTPSGGAQVSSSLAASIGIDFQPMKAAGILDANNLVAMRINGLTGLTSIYRR